MYIAKGSAHTIILICTTCQNKKKPAKIPKKISSGRDYLLKLIRTHLDEDKSFLYKLSIVIALNTFKTSP